MDFARDAPHKIVSAARVDLVAVDEEPQLRVGVRGKRDEGGASCPGPKLCITLTLGGGVVRLGDVPRAARVTACAADDDSSYVGALCAFVARSRC